MQCDLWLWCISATVDHPYFLRVVSLCSRLQAEPSLHARYRLYRSLPRAVIGDLTGHCTAAEIQTPRATATSWGSLLGQGDTVAEGGNHPFSIELGQVFGDAFAAIFDGKDLPTIEFPSIEPDVITDDQATSPLFSGQLHLQSVEEDGPCLLAPQPAVPFVSHTQSFSESHIKQTELLLLRSLICSQNFRGPPAEHVPTDFLRVGSDPNGDFPVEGGGLGDLEFKKMVTNGGNDGETIVGADPIVVLSLWEAYVWRVMETDSMLKSLLMRVDWAMKQCSSSSVMFTRCVFCLL
jgi:hypothetical protein